VDVCNMDVSVQGQSLKTNGTIIFFDRPAAFNQTEQWIAPQPFACLSLAVIAPSHLPSPSPSSSWSSSSRFHSLQTHGPTSIFPPFCSNAAWESSASVSDKEVASGAYDVPMDEAGRGAEDWGRIGRGVDVWVGII